MLCIDLQPETIWRNIIFVKSVSSGKSNLMGHEWFLRAEKSYFLRSIKQAAKGIKKLKRELVTYSNVARIDKWFAPLPTYEPSLLARSQLMQFSKARYFNEIWILCKVTDLIQSGSSLPATAEEGKAKCN